MIYIISMGDAFSGGGAVLKDLVTELSKTAPIKMRNPIGFSSYWIINRFYQLVWFFLWPLFFLNNSSLLLLAHSFFLLSPFRLLINRNRIIFLFQGEEHLALRGRISIAAKYFFQTNIKNVFTIPTNVYLANIASEASAKVLLTEHSLGPKKAFFSQVSNSRNKTNKIVFFGRLGHNKAIKDSILLANALPKKFTSVFIVPDVNHKEYISGYVDSTIFVTTDYIEIISILSEATAVFLPSYYEGLSLPLLEALALKVPVITFSDGFPKYYSEVSKFVIHVKNRNISDAIFKVTEISDILREEFMKVECTTLNTYSYELFCSEAALICSNLYSKLKKIK